MLTRRSIAAALFAAAGIVPPALAGAPALPSSHREAPHITEIPKCDATDFYMFNSYETGREGYVTIVADYLPLQDPYGGPNYFALDPEARYEIHIDNDGDAKEDITFRFQVKNINKDIKLSIGGKNVSIPLIQAGQILAGNNAALNVQEQYTCKVIYNGNPFSAGTPLRNAANNSATFTKPADYIGTKTFPNYEQYAKQYMYNVVLPGCNQQGRLFVGQRKDPFVVNLGETFDLVNTNPLGPENGEPDSLAFKNVTSLILEVPASFLRCGSETVIGGWTTASLPQVRFLRKNPTFANPTVEEGAYIQVSRLGMPLVNEVVIGLRDKDRFNASEPKNDGQFIDYVTNPTVPALLNILFGVTAPCTPRNDLVTAFLTGVPGLNQPANVVPSEMLRLNTNVNPAAGGIPAKPKGMQNRLGVIGGDLAGFPNGRRPGDDVVDVTLRVAMGVLIPNAGQPGSCAPQGNLPFSDGAFVSDQSFDATWPYIRTPLPGAPN